MKKLLISVFLVSSFSAFCESSYESCVSVVSKGIKENVLCSLELKDLSQTVDQTLRYEQLQKLSDCQMKAISVCTEVTESSEDPVIKSLNFASNSLKHNVGCGIELNLPSSTPDETFENLKKMDKCYFKISEIYSTFISE